MSHEGLGTIVATGPIGQNVPVTNDYKKENVYLYNVAIAVRYNFFFP